MTDHLTPERLGEVEAQFSSYCGDEGDAYELVHEFREDIQLMVAEIRHSWAEIERLNKVVDWLARVASNGSFGPGGLRRGPQSWREEAERAVGND